MQQARPLQQQHAQHVTVRRAQPRGHPSGDFLRRQPRDRRKQHVNEELHAEEAADLDEGQQLEQHPERVRVGGGVAAPVREARLLQQQPAEADDVGDAGAEVASARPREAERAEQGERLQRLHRHAQRARARPEPHDEMRPAEEEKRGEEECGRRRQRRALWLARAAQHPDPKVAALAARAALATAVGRALRRQVVHAVAAGACEVARRAPPKGGHALAAHPHGALQLSLLRPVAGARDGQRVRARAVCAVRARRTAAPAASRPLGQPRARSAHALEGARARALERGRVAQVLASGVEMVRARRALAQPDAVAEGADGAAAARRRAGVRRVVAGRTFSAVPRLAADVVERAGWARRAHHRILVPLIAGDAVTVDERRRGRHRRRQ